MVRSKLCAHTCTTHRRPVPDRGPSRQDGRVKPRRELRYRRSLIYKVPILRMLGASARYSRTCVPVETSTPPRRRSILHIPRSAADGRARSFRRSSSSRRTRLRWAPPGVQEGCRRFCVGISILQIPIPRFAASPLPTGPARAGLRQEGQGTGGSPRVELGMGFCPYWFRRTGGGGEAITWGRDCSVPVSLGFSPPGPPGGENWFSVRLYCHEKDMLWVPHKYNKYGGRSSTAQHFSGAG